MLGGKCKGNVCTLGGRVLGCSGRAVESPAPRKDTGPRLLVFRTGGFTCMDKGRPMLSYQCLHLVEAGSH